MATTADFEDFFAQNRDGLAKTLALALNDDELGREAVDEAMIRAFRRWSTVSAYANPQGWVFRVGLNWGRSSLRRKLTATRKQGLLRQPSHSIDDLSPDPDLAAAISGLSADHRIVIVLRFYQDWSVAQIADALEAPVGTIKSRLSRALDQLEDQLARPEDE